MNPPQIRSRFAQAMRPLALGLALIAAASGAFAASVDDGLPPIQHGWAEAYYTTPKDSKDDAFKALLAQADALVSDNPGRAEPLVWRAILQSSRAKFDGGVGALKMAKAARQDLLAAEKIQPDVLYGALYTTLGSLYANVPGWPLGFGDKEKAAQYLKRALQLNPDGIDPNYFYAELLVKTGDKAGARTYLDKALAAAPRPGREDADAGRRSEIEQLKAELGRS